ncbi:MAG TPA: TIGR03667 family PPOX class F420-dependent oxidoreductase, partial [Ktedonobacter sp.]|nr:TIGR03667 family PPOX class F420-dependent oxidoreductase [Ktedonobacter sp.]
QNPKVALNFDGNGFGGDIIVITGEAQLSPVDPPADQLPAYVEKYHEFIATRYDTPENFASIYAVAVRIHPLTVRGH